MRVIILICMKIKYKKIVSCRVIPICFAIRRRLTMVNAFAGFTKLRDDHPSLYWLGMKLSLPMDFR
jgi:hypothetical protein